MVPLKASGLTAIRADPLHGRRAHIGKRDFSPDGRSASRTSHAADSPNNPDNEQAEQAKLEAQAQQPGDPAPGPKASQAAHTCPGRRPSAPLGSRKDTGTVCARHTRWHCAHLHRTCVLCKCGGRAAPVQVCPEPHIAPAKLRRCDAGGCRGARPACTGGCATGAGTGERGAGVMPPPPSFAASLRPLRSRDASRPEDKGRCAHNGEHRKGEERCHHQQPGSHQYSASEHHDSCLLVSRFLKPRIPAASEDPMKIDLGIVRTRRCDQAVLLVPPLSELAGPARSLSRQRPFKRSLGDVKASECQPQEARTGEQILATGAGREGEHPLNVMAASGCIPATRIHG